MEVFVVASDLVGVMTVIPLLGFLNRSFKLFNVDIVAANLRTDGSADAQANRGEAISARLRSFRKTRA